MKKRRRRHWILLAVAVFALTFHSPPAVSAEDAAASADAAEGATDAAAQADAEEDPAIAALAREADEIRCLGADNLDPAIDPKTLFDVSLLDEVAVRVDAERLRLLLRNVDISSAQGRGSSHESPAKAALTAKADRADGSAADARIDPRLWIARIDVDRARLSFYELPLARRRALLTSRARRQAKAEAAPSSEELPPEELRQRLAEEQQRVALRAAETARSEAQRVVSTELARLLGVERAQSAFDADLEVRQKEIAEQRDVTIGWQQRALEAREQAGSAADGVYDDLRRALRSARDSLSVALDQLDSDSSGVPAAGPVALAGIDVDIDTSPVRAERDRIEREARRLATKEVAIRRERAAALFDEIDTLNHERLALLDALSPAKRDAVTGFTWVGWDQAASEARQLALILRYHRHVIGEWLSALRHPGRPVEAILNGGVLQLLEWLLAIGVFAWWRRRSTPLLVTMLRRGQDADRRARLPAPSPATRGVAFLGKVHRPVEWLVLVFALKWSLSTTTQQLLEVRLLSVLATWTFGAAFVIDVINALAGAEDGITTRRVDHDAALRLRSLRLVGRVVVVFGLILSISAMLVGRGTIYEWVFSSCWFASIPLLLILVRWWRSVVFRRTEQVRRPSAIQRWVLANRHGWTSFVAATVGGVYLLTGGLARTARNWVGRFVITRRALAYLFRRQLGKLGAQTRAMAPIPDAAFESLGPERPPVGWIATDSDDPIDRLAKRIRERRGGVIAIVGERGMGKTAALERLRGDVADAVLIDSPPSDLAALRARIAETLDLPLGHEQTLESVAAALSASTTVHALLLDNAHRFVQPVMGGLAAFDTLLAAASRHTSTTTWVFALDEVIWPFLELARGPRPLFDEVVRLEAWTESQIARLLETRTNAAGLSPSFEPLLDPLPVTADDIDKQEALAQRAADYYRLLWDSAMGNPGIALDMWRWSLGTDGDHGTAVRVFAPLDTTDLERLPDASVFVLRAVLQLAPAHAEHIAAGTLLRSAEVADALRYAESRGYVEQQNGGYRVTWTWFRTITLFLQRRHLLALR